MESLFYNPWLEIAIAFFIAMVGLSVGLTMFRLKKTEKSLAPHIGKMVSAIVPAIIITILFSLKKGGSLDPVFYITLGLATLIGVGVFLFLYLRK